MVYPFARLTKGATTILAESPCSCPSLMKALATLAKGSKAGSISPARAGCPTGASNRIRAWLYANQA